MRIYEESDPSEREYSSYARFLAQEGERQVGQLELNKEASGWRIANVEVDEDFRRRGIATALFDYAQKELGPLQHSYELKPDGEAWIAHLQSRPSLSKMEFGFSEGEIDPLAPFYAHWDKFSKKALDAIIKHAPIVAQDLQSRGVRMDCGEASHTWKNALGEEGIEVELYDGNYLKDLPSGAQQWGSLPASSDHVWLKVEGHLFDPTAAQFGAEISDEHYRL